MSFGFALFTWERSFLISFFISFVSGVASAMVASPDSMSSWTAISGSNLFDGFELLAFKLSDFGA